MVSSARAVFMIRPMAFQFNSETAVSNDFQNEVKDLNALQVLTTAQTEFDAMVSELRSKNIEVVVFNDTTPPIKPDAIFPNNWISLGQEGIMTVFPMKTANRRLERRQDIIDYFLEKYDVSEYIDMSGYISDDIALEGTGSIVFDHAHRMAYACLSPRTDLKLLENYCQKINYTPIVFHAYDSSHQLIYHTNVVMCVGSGYVVMGLSAVEHKEEKQMLLDTFQSSSLELIELDSTQLLQSFAGNMLEVQSQNGKKYLVMSKRAFSSLHESQIQQISKYAEPLPVSIDIIETIGGGSARCMMAEIYLDKK